MNLLESSLKRSGEKKILKYRLKTDIWGHPKGSIVYDQKYHDYGLAEDDSRLTGVPHISVTLNENGGYPGFTVATHDLEKIVE